MLELDLDFLAPQYAAGSIADVLPSVADGLGVPRSYDILGLGPAQRVIVLVIDGLGLRQLQRHADVAPVLVGGLHRELTAVFPSTTAAALTSIGTGLSPGEHGIVGASFRFGDNQEVLRPLSWSHEPAPLSVQSEPTWWEQSANAGVTVAAVSPRPYRHAGLTRVALGPGTYIGADGPGERIDAITAPLRSAGPGERVLVYGYWEWLDKTGHVQGPESVAFARELAAADSFVAALLAATPAGTRILVTADHGLLGCPDIVDLDELSHFHQGVRLVAGEPRMRHLYCAPGADRDVLQRSQDLLGSAAQVLTRDEAIATGWFGLVPADHQDRIGDVVLIARDRQRLAAHSRDRVISGLPGQHGSLTGEEMAVPLLQYDV
ncbi:alkaline phosphatase family protein [Candidatus Nanopelagicales bacterium]|nr:alkaline phosphatase family protein [Candidatus Nanopelagicales bacterium]